MATVYPKAGQLNAIGLDANIGSGTAALVSFGAPARAVKPTGPGEDDGQQFRIYWRADRLSPSAASYARVQLYEAGHWVADLLSNQLVVSPSLKTVGWDAALLKNKSGADVQVRISGTNEEFGRLEIGAVEWRATWDAAVEPGYVALSISGKQPVVKGNADETIALVSFENPTYAPKTGADLQRFRVYLRASEAGFSPTVDIELWDEEVFVSTLVDDQVISTTAPNGTLVNALWDATNLTDPSGANCQVRIVGTTDTGVAFIEVGAVEWQTNGVDTIPADPDVGSVTLTGYQPVLSQAQRYARPATGSLTTQLSVTTILWDEVTEDVDGNPQTPDGYNVYYSEQSGTGISGSESTTETTLELFLPAGEWNVWVTAYYGAEESDDSQTIQFTTVAGIEPDTVWTHGAESGGLLLAISGLLAPVDAGDNVEEPGVGSLTLTGYQPSLNQAFMDLGWDELVADEATFSGDVDIGATQDDIYKYPLTGSMSLSGHQPLVSMLFRPNVGSLALTGYSVSFAHSIGVSVGSLTLTGRIPTLKRVQAAIEPVTGELALTGYQPNVARTEIVASALLEAGYASMHEVYSQQYWSGTIYAGSATIQAGQSGIAAELVAGEATLESRGWVCTHPDPETWNSQDTSDDTWVTQTTPSEVWNG